jgi:alanine racemase
MTTVIPSAPGERNDPGELYNPSALYKERRMTRAARAVIDLDALRHNLQRACTADPAARQFAVIKANGYGHGLVPVAQALTAADGFAVASLEEAITLRDAGISQPILLLEGFFNADELPAIQHHALDIVVHHAAQLDALESVTLADGASALSVWLKVDTGMHRLGFAIGEVPAAWERLSTCAAVQQPPRLMTHLACADDFGHPATLAQLARFNALLSELSKSSQQIETSIANSAGILGWMGSHGDIDRPGIMLYGVSPFMGETGDHRRLRPVMTLRSELIAIKHCRQGDAVGYGGDWLCPQDMRIGVVAMGYGDGYPRHAPAGTPVLVNGLEVPLIGRVSMDMICVDLRKQGAAKVGDAVVLWGEGLPAETVADAASTIAYELFCGVTARVPREYIGQ